MVEDRPWGTSPEQTDQLKAKINAYAGYLFDGTIFEHYPEIAGKPVRVQLDCVDTPPAHISAITDRAAERARQAPHRLQDQPPRLAHALNADPKLRSSTAAASDRSPRSSSAASSAASASASSPSNHRMTGRR